MDIDNVLSMVVDDGVKVDSSERKESKENIMSVRGECQCLHSCWGWEEKCKQAEERFGVLISMFEKKIGELESLERKHRALQLEKVAIDDEVQSLRKKNEELEEKVACTLDDRRVISGVGEKVESVVGLTEDEGDDKVMELMIENKGLDCEKKKAESEVGVWKTKCKELEFQVLEFEQRLNSFRGEHTSMLTTKVGLESPGRGMEETSWAKAFRGEGNDVATPSVDVFDGNLTNVVGGGRGIDMDTDSRARKQLVFGDEGSPSKKIAPATPAGVRPASLSIIDISDSEDEEKAARLSTPNLQASENTHESIGGGISLGKKEFLSKKNLTSAFDQADEDDAPWQNVFAPSMSTFKRKRATNIVASDDESDIDDHFPISRLRTNSKIVAASPDKLGEPVVRRRLVTLRNLKEKGISKNSSHSNAKRIQIERLCGIPTNKISSDEEVEEDESDSDEDGFIVHDSDSSEGDSASEDSKGDDKSNSDGASSGADFSGESDYAFEVDIDYEAIIARIGRRKDHKVKWEFEGDMLAAFGKDAQLCMKAVCALYRRQTSEEKFHKATIDCNGRGFSQPDAYRGSRLGEFLTDGDPQGDLVKSVEELEAYDPEGVELCRTLAEKYHGQLFTLYKNNEDPLWPSLEPK